VKTLHLQPRNPEVENWDGRREPLGDALNQVIGIRVEDDILVTKDGPELLSGHIPRTVEDIERTMAN
jgi:hypothetical protein